MTVLFWAVLILLIGSFAIYFIKEIPAVPPPMAYVKVAGIVVVVFVCVILLLRLLPGAPVIPA